MTREELAAELARHCRQAADLARTYAWHCKVERMCNGNEDGEVYAGQAILESNRARALLEAVKVMGSEESSREALEACKDAAKHALLAKVLIGGKR